MTGPLEESLSILRDGQTLVEQPFRSRVPLLGPMIAWFRTRWNNVSTTWYIRPLIARQNRFNSAVVEHLAAQNARIESQEAQIANMAARLDHVDALLAGAAAQLDDQRAQIDLLRDRLRDHDAWLIERDHEQSGTARDLAELTLQLIQLNRRLQELTKQSPDGAAGRSPAEHSE
jgi:chromosome segregation ATPase